MYDYVRKQDNEVFAALEGEEQREAEGLELIPSENYVSKAVREANGSCLTNKYSEGYPGKRYYGGQEFTDKVEQLAIDRAKKIFGCDHANVQPLGGANANIGAYFAWLDPGDTVLGMDLGHGGHLTHGAPVTYMAKLYRFIRYKMKNIETGEIDYDEMREIAKKEKPKIILGGFSGYPRELDWQKISDIAKEVGAVAMADVAHIAGLIAGGVAKNPFDYGFQIVTTTTHKTLRGPRGGMILSKGIVSSPLKAPEKTVENLPTLIDRSVFPGLQGGPHMNNIAAKAIALGEAMQPPFKGYAAQIVKNARAMAKVFQDANIRLIAGGTDNHLVLADVWSSLSLGGKDAEGTLDKVGITLNKNAIADDTRKPFDPSGIRFGTPAITTRKFTEKESARVAELMIEAMQNKSEEKKLSAIREEIRTLCKKFPIPESFV
ncbi:serine hydroxymethyltransferase [Candidatus Kaiserbacteria bacterium RIFCSPLOWO2_12_FULL_53_8]|uniref:Serine hydroxymethyltransferase n=2 Tax=Candidatus Kaiseribacteriota TaxID=1752734 RepID=A0A1F6CUR5_9BACT|nr:MAG: serine hydroxymethyltransferase [Candidatus Kaiserbacteria bacterium RIFCSPHIGHO2_01_FULL_53_29]OGG91613.1 MAG: serine hydroxymethyltransferase [Candidatus Kaiserbacteria bacterium RIFCSPLOWO2_12_FULL_53_8]